MYVGVCVCMCGCVCVVFITIVYVDNNVIINFLQFGITFVVISAMILLVITMDISKVDKQLNVMYETLR